MANGSLDAIEATWDAHTAAEFVIADVDATMATMTDDPTVVHVATSVGARGLDAVRRFYIEYFIGHQAADMTLVPRTRTVTAERLVDELTVSFTHDVIIPWVLPGVAPTGCHVTMPLVAIIGMRDGLVHTEHIYWDQASVLAQIGMLATTGLPVVGAGQADVLAPASDPTTLNRLLA